MAVAVVEEAMVARAERQVSVSRGSQEIRVSAETGPVVVAAVVVVAVRVDAAARRSAS